jgi:hypothetical protein
MDVSHITRGLIRCVEPRALWLNPRKHGRGLPKSQIKACGRALPERDPCMHGSAPFSCPSFRGCGSAPSAGQAVESTAAGSNASSTIATSRIRNFWILPVTVIGKLSTSFQ